jgi:hypothetical protein
VQATVPTEGQNYPKIILQASDPNYVRIGHLKPEEKTKLPQSENIHTLG